MLSRILAAVFAMALSVQPLFAGQFVKVDLEPISHTDAKLVIVGSDGSETSYSPAELETFPTYSLTTKTPWRDEPATFAGVKLSDVLAAHGLDAVSSILVTAENDYTTVMPKELLDSIEILIATRVDGRPHTRRARGPIQFVIDMDAFTTSKMTAESNLVWMAARIEAKG